MDRYFKQLKLIRKECANYMSWSSLKFGKYKGKSLPQVIFIDPDWFFWAMENNIFEGKGMILGEAQELYRKSKSIHIPQKGSDRLVAEYAIHPPTKKFGHMELVPESRPKHEGSTQTFRSNVINLSIPRQISPYDKLGCKHLLKNVKYCLFGNKSIKMTKTRCEEFFENDDNFD